MSDYTGYAGVLQDHSDFEHHTMERSPRSADDIIADIDRVAKSLNVLLKEAAGAGFIVTAWVEDIEGTKIGVALEKELG